MIKFRLLGIQLSSSTLDEAVQYVDDMLAAGDRATIAFANPEILLNALDNEALQTYLAGCTQNFVDGIGIILAARLHGVRVPERVTGTDFTYRLAQLSAKKRYSLFFLGGKPGVAEQAAENLTRLYPGCAIVGTHHGFFDQVQSASVIEKINACRPDVLMVCLGSPGQEEWIARNFGRLRCTLAFANGGALDFASGIVKRAPAAIQRAGFEWLWRLFQDFTIRRIRRQLRLARFPFELLRRG